MTPNYTNLLLNPQALLHLLRQPLIRSDSSVTTPKSSCNTLAQHPSLSVLVTRYSLLRAQLKAIYSAILEPSSTTFLSPNHGKARNNCGRGRGRGGYHDRVDKHPWTPEREVSRTL
jgi:hypothetical protein